MANKFKQVFDNLAPHLAEMSMLAGPEYKVTFIARNYIRDDADIILGDDFDYEDVIAVLAKYKDAPPRIVNGEVAQ